MEGPLIKRRYIYDTTFDEVMKFAREQQFRPLTPNNKSNFPFMLQQYMNYLKFKAGMQLKTS